MPFELIIISVSVLGVLAAVAVAWGAARQRRRRDFLRQRAEAMAQHGWYPAPVSPWLAEVAGRIFAKGHPSEMFAGDFRGQGLCVLEYLYSTSNGKTTQTHLVHIVALNLPVALPP